MSTKSNRSSGTQHNSKGVTQGNTLVGPQSGLPIDEVVDTDGVRRLAVDANFVAQNVQANVELEYTEDSVAIGDPNSNNTLAINADGSIDSNVEIDSADGDNIAIKDSDGNELDVNPDGSINTVVTNFPAIQDVNVVSIVEVEIKNDSGNTLPISGTVTANQGGTWDINDITGTVSLPTGASTESKQDVGNSSLASIDTKLTDKSQFTKITDGTDTVEVNTDGSINTRILEGFASFFQLVGDSNWMKLGTYDNVSPTLSLDGKTLTLAYSESGNLIGEAEVYLNSNTDWSVALNRYINNDGEGLLLDDDDNPLNLD